MPITYNGDFLLIIMHQHETYFHSVIRYITIGILFQIWTIVFLLIVLCSIGILCIETMPGLRIWHPDEEEADPISAPPGMNGTTPGDGSTRLYNITTMMPMTTEASADDIGENKKIKQLLHSDPHPVLEHIDTFCTCFFTIEFLVRLIVAPDRIAFMKNLMNIIDILCVLPMWIKYIMVIYSIKMNMQLLPLFFLIMMLRVLRICRVLRLARHYTGVKILLLALKASFKELGMLMIFVFIVVLIFSVVIYYAEFFEDDTFEHIPAGYWWAIITLTTVGYGDMYPKSGIGCVVGAMCALTGILATGLPVPIIANNFNIYYSHAKLKDAVRSRGPPARRASSTSVDTKAIMGTEDAKQEPLIIKEATV